MKKTWLIAIIAVCIIGALLSIAINSSKVSSDNELVIESIPEKEEVVLRFGLPENEYIVEDGVIKNGESFSTILLNYGVGYSIIHKIAEYNKEIFDVRYMRAGKKFAVLKDANDSLQKAHFFVYQPSPVQYYIFDLVDSLNIKLREKDIEIRTREIASPIESSLYQSIVDQGASPELVLSLSEIYAWTIDFFRIQKGDYFKVVFEEKFIDDTVFVGIGNIIAADFFHRERSFYSFYFQGDSAAFPDYYDEKGNTLRKAFLRAPLKFSRISSRYSPKRFHPVLKRWKAHLGTDYAAPKGTPIMSTADGIIEAAAYTSGNGNYVKVRHNSTYTSQYLHMSKFEKGIRKGKAVKQGDIIGYVGSTGLATGPHVCYRFWVNGKQVDPLKQDLPDADPIDEIYKESFLNHIAPLKAKLDSLNLIGKEEVLDDLPELAAH